MHWLDRIVAQFSPTAAVRRTQARRVLAAYESAGPGRTRKTRPDNRSGNALTERAGTRIRGYARNLDQNHDIARGILNTLVNNVVGPNGISIEPMPRNANGEVDEDLRGTINALLKGWARRPEVTREHAFGGLQRLVARTWFRDGECLTQMLSGNVQYLDHAGPVPLSLELIEADLLPMDLNDAKRGIVQGVERDAWGRPRGYHIYKAHPGDSQVVLLSDTKRLDAENCLHLKLVDRFRQARGVSIFAAVMQRLEDIKDYEESERVAARIAAAMTAYIKKGSPAEYIAPEDGQEDRSFSVRPGMVFDTLIAGEEIGTIESNRPSSLLEGFREAMLRAVSAATSANYSTISRNYNGTYSAQRQELVEGWMNYASLTTLFVEQFVEPVYRRLINDAVAAGRLQVPRGASLDALMDAEFRGPVMPWVDPQKEANGIESLIESRIKSPQQIIRERGGNPDAVLDQFEQWEKELDRRGLSAVNDTDSNAGGSADAETQGEG